jgi:protease I
MPNALIILAQSGYQDHEYAGTRSGLESAGYAITIGSSAVGTCTGKGGSSEEATIALSDVDVSTFDKVAFVGGPGAAAFIDDSDAHRIARDTVSQGKILGAICIAPTILARAGVLKHKKATVWDSGGEQAALLEGEGAYYTGESVTVDGNIVTANGPPAAEEFGQVLAAL